MSTSSAIPEYLDLFAERSTEIDDSLAHRAKGLGAALDRLRSSGSVGLGIVPQLDAEVVGLVARGRSLAQRVEMIADGFLKADLRSYGPPAPTPTVRTVDNADLRRSMRIVELVGRARSVAADREPFELMDRLRPMTRGEWFEAVYGPDCLSFGSDRFYTGGGSVLGPDGRRYPLVVPNLVIDGRVYNADFGLRPDQAGVASLGGSDPGWWTIGTRTGVTRFAPQAGFVESAFITAAGTNSNISRRATAVGPDGLATIRVDPNGRPSLPSAKKGANTPPPVPASVDEVASPAYVAMDGHLVEFDRMRPESLSRAVRRSGWVAPNRSAERMARGMGAADLASQVIAGIDLAAGVDDFKHFAYQAVLEENLDGRRRAQLRTYAVSVEPSSDPVITPYVAHYEDDLVRSPLVFRQWSEPMSSLDEGFSVRQRVLRREDVIE